MSSGEGPDVDDASFKADYNSGDEGTFYSFIQDAFADCLKLLYQTRRCSLIPFKLIVLAYTRGA